MTAVSKAKTQSGGWPNGKQITVAQYSFAVDGGAQGALDLFTAVGAVIITGFYAYVRTAVTSGGSATIKVGVTGSDAKFITVAEGAKASYSLAAVLKPLPTIALSEGTPNTAVIALPLPHRLADGEKVLMTIGTADLTAGVVDFVIETMPG